MSSNSGGEGQIRAEIVEADLVSCMVALTTQLFRSTGIPVCVWFFAKDKGARAGEVLFIDARNLGDMIDRAERALSDDDIARIAGTFHAWRGIESDAAALAFPPPEPPLVERAKQDEMPTSTIGIYRDIPGFCYSAALAEIKAADYALTPGRYVGAAEAEDDGEPIEEKLARLRAELEAQFTESARLAEVVREQLERVDV
jgi:type I restriction enzyme M protein